MYCVIQEVERKRVPAGEPRRIEGTEERWKINGDESIHYGYQYSSERFERPARRSYRISIHESHRENRKVRKKQTVICTINYYDVVSYGGYVADYVAGGLKPKADALGLSEEELSDMIYRKWQPIVDKILAEFEKTEEYAAKEENSRIIREHNKRIEDFSKRYGLGRDEYSRCYDVFGKLRNPEYLEKIKADHKARQEYERRSREQQRSCYEKFYGNYGGCGGSSYCGTVVNNHNEADKAMLKKFYRTLSKAFHPDSNPGRDTAEEMAMLNRLKSEWGI